MLRKQMQRAVILKYNLGLLHAVLRGWHSTAAHRRNLMQRCVMLLASTEAQMVRRAWVRWCEWMAEVQQERGLDSKAVGYLRNLLLARAWNTWRAHHDFCA